MKIHKFEIKDLTTHNGIFEFGEGITGIAGSCGCGKSNLKNLLKLFLTNVVPKKATSSLINLDKAEGYGILEGEVGGTPFRIKRKLTTKGHDKIEATIGDKYFDRVNPTYEELYSLINAPRELVAEICLASQRDSGGFLFEIDSKRNSKLQSLLGLNNIKSAHNLVIQELSTINITDYEEEKKLEQETLQELQATKERLQEDRKKIEIDQEQIDELASEVASKDEVKNRVKKAERQVPKLKKQISDLKSDHKKVVDLKRELKEKLVAKKEGLSEAQELIKSFDQQEGHRSQYLQLKENIDESESDLSEFTDTFTEDNFSSIYQQKELLVKKKEDELQKIKDSLLELRDSIKGMEVFLSAVGRSDEVEKYIFGPFEQSDDEKCYVCGTRFENAEGKVDITDHQKAVKEFDDLNRKQTQIEAEIKDDKKIRKVFDLETKSPAKRLIESRKKLSTLKEEVSFITRDDKKKAQILVEEFNALKIQFTEVKDKPEDINKQVQSLEKELSGLEEDMKQSVNDEDLEGMKKNLASLRAQLNKRIELNTKIEGLEDNIKVCAQKLKSYEAKIREASKNREIKDILEDVKRITHRDVLPMKCLSNTVSQINRAFLSKQREIGLDVEVYLDEETLEPRVVSSKFKRVAGKDFLSGGQETAVSLSFMLSIWELLLPNVDLMILDEPTEFLNDEYIENIVDVLNKVKAGLGRRQLLLMSHNQRFRESVMDDVINLEQ